MTHLVPGGVNGKTGPVKIVALAAVASHATQRAANIKREKAAPVVVRIQNRLGGAGPTETRSTTTDLNDSKPAKIAANGSSAYIRTH